MPERLRVRVRVVLVGPPEGVAFGIQFGKEVPAPVVADAPTLSLEAEIEARGEPAAGPPDFFGPAVQGPPSGRFLYVNSGSMAGQGESCWCRRAKIPLAGLGWEVVRAASERDGTAAEARVLGCSCDGGPICASTPLLPPGWHLAPPPAARCS